MTSSQKERPGGRPRIKGTLGLNLETREEFLLYLGAVKSWSEVLSHIRENYNISDEMYAICDGDENLKRHLEDYGYKIQQCTNHFVKTSIYYLWKEQYPNSRLVWRIDTTQKELLSIANELLSSNKDSNTAKFILRTAGIVTLFAESTTRGI